jgi:hypothetical protein
MPTIEQIRYGGVTLPVDFGIIDASQLRKKRYVSYCIMSGNIPPASKLELKFHYEKTNQTFWMTESK